MTCYDCIHCGACSDAGDSGYSSLKEDVSKCKHFKNKADFIELPYKPFPVVLSEDENNSDVFCPFCYTDLSGHYYGGDYEPPKIIPCFECGTWLDGTKAITKEEAEQVLVNYKLSKNER